MTYLNKWIEKWNPLWSVTTPFARVNDLPKWIGIVGNEEADSFAKAAIEKKNEVDFNVGIPKSQIKSRLKEVDLQNWQERWENSLDARWTYAQNSSQEMHG
ncbi:hypothetical protein AVEN_106194-1 [Araneus ventricosus]|uniref:RNase H type-1 domain-containing protein n=1 Tax=Araneus ventricosus TaxID=182803 RepID=A0A4Y2TS29_ARAVE|nr:hypothetical protein AVEN_106194-1 [Araneus ventricosus]